MTAAFGLIAALAWNDAIKKAIESIPEIAKYGPLVYAVIVTILAVIMTIWIARIAAKMK